jgi:hypothetical protein
MKTKFLVFSIFLAALTPSARSEITGYLSVDYAKGQEQARLPQGSFENPRFGLVFSGEVTPRVDYFSEVRFKGESRFELEQVWVGLKPSPSLNLKFGLYLVPFGRYNQANRPHQNLLINAPLHEEKLYPLSWRDTGILAEGRLRGLFYSAYLGNGLVESVNLSDAQQFKDNNKNKGIGGRVGAALGQWSKIAFSYYRGKYDERNERNLTLRGLDFAWATEGFQLLAEYSEAAAENPESYDNGKAEGYFVQASFVMDNLRPVVSYQKMRYEDRFHGLGFISPDNPGAGIQEERSRWTVGFGYFLSPRILFKFEYDFNREKGDKIKDDSYSLQLALSF